MYVNWVEYFPTNKKNRNSKLFFYCKHDRVIVCKTDLWGHRRAAHLAINFAWHVYTEMRTASVSNGFRICLFFFFFYITKYNMIYEAPRNRTRLAPPSRLYRVHSGCIDINGKKNTIANVAGVSDIRWRSRVEKITSPEYDLMENKNTCTATQRVADTRPRHLRPWTTSKRV